MADRPVVVAVFGHGRRTELDRTLSSFEQNVDPDMIAARFIFDDSTDPAYQAEIAETFDWWSVIGGTKRLGFGGNIERAWSALQGVHAPYVFHLEEDFTFNRPIDLAGMIAVLDTQPDLVQLALLRQPVGKAEKATGGFIGADPDSFVDRTDGEHEWFEHRKFFTTNPSLYRKSLMRDGWPNVEHSEGMFTHRVLHLGTPETQNPRFGFWGRTDQTPAVHHIGDDRGDGTGY